MKGIWKIIISSVSYFNTFDGFRFLRNRMGMGMATLWKIRIRKVLNLTLLAYFSVYLKTNNKNKIIKLNFCTPLYHQQTTPVLRVTNFYTPVHQKHFGPPYRTQAAQNCHAHAFSSFFDFVSFIYLKFMTIRKLLLLHVTYFLKYIVYPLLSRNEEQYLNKIQNL